MFIVDSHELWLDFLTRKFHMSNDGLMKATTVAVILVVAGSLAAHNARWVRDGVSPWWTSYFFSFVSASIYAYMLRANLFSLTYTSAFQTFFFHASWYLTAIFLIGEQLSTHRIFGLISIFLGMILMSIK